LRDFFGFLQALGSLQMNATCYHTIEPSTVYIFFASLNTVLALRILIIASMAI